MMIADMARLVAVALFTVTLAACPSDSTTGGTAEADGGAESSSKIKLKNGADETVFSLKLMDDGAKLVDASEKTIARLKTKDTKIKIKDRDETVLGYVTEGEGKLKLKNPEQTVVLFALEVRSDGDLRLVDGAGATVYEIKKRDYGFEVHDDKDVSLYKVKLKEGKTSIRNASDQTVLQTKDPVATSAAACLALDRLSLPQQAALCLALQRRSAASH